MDDPGIDAAPEAWSEARLGDLGATEHDFQEFKGCEWLMAGGGIASGFLSCLSKQVSAFANGAGGRIFVGIDDAGRVDGGVRVDLKGGGTRAWLEDVIPHCVEPQLTRFNVFEVQAIPGERSRIRPGHAVYVIRIDASDDAPHQAHDHRYYLRIAGKSRPMGHIHVEDVLRRRRSPRVELSRVGPYGEPERILSDPRGPKVVLGFHTVLRNGGRTLARHVGAEILLPRPLVPRDVRRRMLESEGMQLTQHPGSLVFFRYQATPLFPDQEVGGMAFWVGLHRTNLARVRAGEAITWRVYADDAPAVTGRARLENFSVVRRSLAWLESEPLDGVDCPAP